MNTRLKDLPPLSRNLKQLSRWWRSRRGRRYAEICALLRQWDAQKRLTELEAYRLKPYFVASILTMWRDALKAPERARLKKQKQRVAKELDRETDSTKRSQLIRKRLDLMRQGLKADHIAQARAGAAGAKGRYAIDAETWQANSDARGNFLGSKTPGHWVRVATWQETGFRGRPPSSALLRTRVRLDNHLTRMARSLQGEKLSRTDQDVLLATLLHDAGLLGRPISTAEQLATFQRTQRRSRKRQPPAPRKRAP